MNHLKMSLRKLGKRFGLQQELLKREKDHEEKFEKFEDSWEGSRDEWTPYLKTDFFVFSFHLCKIHTVNIKNYFIWNER